MGVAYIFYNTGMRRRTDMKVGFIGGGNMASAMIGGMIQKGVVSADDILVSVRTEKSVERLTNQFGVQATMDNEAVVAGSDLVFLAVKPNQIKNIINLVKNFISPEKIIVSILPGKSLQWLGTEIGKPTKLIRTMPNTPALVGEGMTGVCANDLVTEEERRSCSGVSDGYRHRCQRKLAGVRISFPGGSCRCGRSRRNAEKTGI